MHAEEHLPGLLKTHLHKGSVEMAVDPDLRWFFYSPKYRLRSLYRSIRSQGLLAGLRLFLQTSNTSPGLVSVRLPGFLAPMVLRKGTSDIGTFEDIFVTGEYSVHTAIDPAVIIDAGANIGCASIYFATNYPSARIIAVEPSQSNFDLLVQNTKEYGNIKPVHAAVWGQAAHLRIENPSAMPNSFVVIEEGAPSEGTMRGMTIGQIAKEAGYDQVDMLKMDIEGAEINVFSSPDMSWLRDVRLILIEFHDRFRPGCSAAFYRAICSYDFQQRAYADLVEIVK